MFEGAVELGPQIGEAAAGAHLGEDTFHAAWIVAGGFPDAAHDAGAFVVLKALEGVERRLAVLFGPRDRLSILVGAQPLLEVRKSRLHRSMGRLPGRRSCSPEALDRATHAVEQHIDSSAMDRDTCWLLLLRRPLAAVVRRTGSLCIG